MDTGVEGDGRKQLGDAAEEWLSLRAAAPFPHPLPILSLWICKVFGSGIDFCSLTEGGQRDKTCCLPALSHFHINLIPGVIGT